MVQYMNARLDATFSALADTTRRGILEQLGHGSASVTDLAAKFRSFGWDVVEIDGHDHAQIEAALKPHGGDVPRAVIASTIKGKGCKEMENNPAWHHKAPKADELEAVLAQLA